MKFPISYFILDLRIYTHDVAPSSSNVYVGPRTRTLIACEQYALFANRKKAKKKGKYAYYLQTFNRNLRFENCTCFLGLKHVV